MNKRSFSGGAAKRIAFVGIAAATIECAKLALAFLPNVEVVTLLTALYGYSFGWLGVLSAIVFVCIEPLIWGVNTWVVLYFIYWPLVACIFMILGKAKVKNRWIITLTVVVLTVFFGLLSSFIDVGLFSGYFDNFFYRFSVYYLRGLPFYLAQIATNAVVFPLLFLFISQKLQKLSAAFR